MRGAQLAPAVEMGLATVAALVMGLTVDHALGLALAVCIAVVTPVLAAAIALDGPVAPAHALALVPAMVLAHALARVVHSSCALAHHLAGAAPR